MGSVSYAPVRFKIEADNKPALKAIDEVEAYAKRLSNIKVEFKLPTVKRLQDVTKKLLEMSMAMGSFSSANNFKSFTEGIEKLGSVKISKSLMDFFRDSTIVETMRDFSKLVADFPDTSNFVKFTEGMANLKGVNFSGLRKYMDAAKAMQYEMPDKSRYSVGSLTDAIQAEWEQFYSDGGLSDAVDASKLGLEGLIAPDDMVDKAETQVNGLGKAILFAAENWDAFRKGAVKALKNAISYCGKFLTTIKNVAEKGFNRLTETVRNATSGISSFLHSIGRIAMYRAIRTALKEITSAFKEGIDNMYQWSLLNNGVFASSMDRFASSSLYLKNSIGAMVAPVLNALVPIVEKVTQAFVNATNAVNQFISALTGQSTWTKALYTPVQYAEQAGNNLKEADKQAKKFKATILGFDELHVLNDNSEDTSDLSPSAGAGGLNYGSMFEEQPLSDFWKKWLNTDDWYDLGKLFALKANDWLREVDEWILGTFRPWAMTWSKRLATFLNGFVDYFDFRLLGKTIADGMMVIIDAVNQFFDLFQAYHFGERLWETVDEWFKTMNWEAVGQFFANGINFVADTAAGFLSKFKTNAEEYGKDLAIAFKSWVDDIHWENIRSALLDGLASVAGVIRGFVSNEDGAWDTFRKEFTDTIKAVIGSPDLDEIIDAGTSLINSIIQTIPDLPWFEIGEKIGYALGNIKWGELLYNTAVALGKGLLGALKGWFDSDDAFGNTAAVAIVGAIGGAVGIGGVVAKGALMKIGENMAGQIGAGLASEAATSGLASQATVLGAAIPGGLALPLVGAVAGVAAAVLQIKEHWADLTSATQVYADLNQAKAEQLASAAKLQAALAAQGIDVSLEDVNNHLNGLISMSELTGGKWEELCANAERSSGNMTTTVSNNLSNVADSASKTFDSVGGATTDFAGAVNDAVTKLLTSASDGSSESMKELADSTVKIFQDVSDAVSRINQALSNSFSQMASSISQSMQRMYDSVSTNMAKIASNVENAAARIQKAFNSVSSSSSATIEVKGYATGGFPEDGLFMANHGELVGGFSNGRTAVANNDQIVAGIESGVYNAVSNALSSQNSGGDIVLRIDSEEIARASTRGQRRLDRRMNPTVKFTG